MSRSILNNKNFFALLIMAGLLSCGKTKATPSRSEDLSDYLSQAYTNEVFYKEQKKQSSLEEILGDLDSEIPNDIKNQTPLKNKNLNTQMEHLLQSLADEKEGSIPPRDNTSSSNEVKALMEEIEKLDSQDETAQQNPTNQPQIIALNQTNAIPLKIDHPTPPVQSNKSENITTAITNNAIQAIVPSEQKRIQDTPTTNKTEHTDNLIHQIKNNTIPSIPTDERKKELERFLISLPFSVLASLASLALIYADHRRRKQEEAAKNKSTPPKPRELLDEIFNKKTPPMLGYKKTKRIKKEIEPIVYPTDRNELAEFLWAMKSMDAIKSERKILRKKMLMAKKTNDTNQIQSIQERRKELSLARKKAYLRANDKKTLQIKEERRLLTKRMTLARRHKDISTMNEITQRRFELREQTKQMSRQFNAFNYSQKRSDFLKPQTLENIKRNRGLA